MTKLALVVGLLIAAASTSALATELTEDVRLSSKDRALAGATEVSLVVSAEVFPLTVTWHFTDWQNCTATEKFPLTKVFDKSGTFPVFQFSRLDKTKPYRCRYALHWRRGDARRAAPEPCSFRLPFAAKGTATVLQGFNGQPTHQGDQRYALDFAMAEGTPVVAARAGTVILVVDDEADVGRVEGNLVLIVHADGTLSEYAHLQRGSVTARVGQRVDAGTTLARSGQTGQDRTIAPHLHFSVLVPWDGEAGRKRTVPFELKGPSGKCAAIKEADRL